MKLNLTLLAFLFCVIAFTSCSIEKRIYEKGYHISWLHKHDFAQKTAIADAPIHYLPAIQIDTNFTNIASKKESITTSAPTLNTDTIAPTTKDDDYFGQKETTLPKENKEPFFGHPIRKPKTVEQLKKAIGRDFKLVLLAMILGGISGGLLALVGPSATSVGDGLVFLTVVFVLSIAGFIFYLIRGLLRILKLTVLKIFGKKDDVAINKKEKKHRLRESEHQYLRRFGLWFGQNLFSPIGRLKILGLLLLIAIPILVILNPH